MLVPKREPLRVGCPYRLYCYENYKYGGLNIDSKYQSIRRAIMQIEETHRYSKWFAWFSDGTIADIFACRGDL